MLRQSSRAAEPTSTVDERLRATTLVVRARIASPVLVQRRRIAVETRTVVATGHGPFDPGYAWGHDLFRRLLAAASTRFSSREARSSIRSSRVAVELGMAGISTPSLPTGGVRTHNVDSFSRRSSAVMSGRVEAASHRRAQSRNSFSNELDTIQSRTSPAGGPLVRPLPHRLRTLAMTTAVAAAPIACHHSSVLAVRQAVPTQRMAAAARRNGQYTS